MTDENCKVAEHEVVGAGYRRLVLESPEGEKTVYDVTIERNSYHIERADPPSG